MQNVTFCQMRSEIERLRLRQVAGTHLGFSCVTVINSEVNKELDITQNTESATTVNIKSFNQAKNQEKEDFIKNTPALCLTATTEPWGLEMNIKYT